MVSYAEARNLEPTDIGATTLPPWFASFLPSDRAARILDIGCGHGGMLAAFRRAGYENVEGVEIDEESVQFCRDNGLKVSSIDMLSDEASRLGQFDLIIMNHVLEHFPKARIIDLLKKVRPLLKPGAAFYVGVPNAQANTGAYWAYEDFTHSTLFTSGSLFYVAKMAGYNNIQFLDIDSTAGVRPQIAFCRSLLLKLYRANYNFWNSVTRSRFHTTVPAIFSYEIKALLRV